MQGLIDRLDYIQGAGFNGIYITGTPWQNPFNSYHGYYAGA